MEEADEQMSGQWGYKTDLHRPFMAFALVVFGLTIAANGFWLIHIDSYDQQDEFRGVPGDLWIYGIIFVIFGLGLPTILLDWKRVWLCGLVSTIVGQLALGFFALELWLEAVNYDKGYLLATWTTGGLIILVGTTIGTLRERTKIHERKLFHAR